MSGQKGGGSGINEAMAEELVRQAQAVIQAQLAAGDAVTTTLTTLLTQSITLSLASLGAASLHFSPTGAWLPWWAAGFLAGAGLGWIMAAVYAVFALRPIRWDAPGISPRKLWVNKVLLPATTADGYLFIARTLQEALDNNSETLDRLIIKTKIENYLFTRYAILFGILADIVWLLVNYILTCQWN